MLYDVLGESQIKITLSAVEICDYFGSFEDLRYDNAKARTALGNILLKAMGETDFSLSGERLYIKVVPTENGGCTICFLVSDRKKRRMHRSHRFYIYEFSKCEDLLITCEQIKNLSHTDIPLSLYENDGKYRLFIPKNSVCRAVLALGPEFAERILSSDSDFEKTKEHWHCICANTPISKIIVA